jgi:RsiW-degrading membrane proteinase PrsW (M82 family)
VPHIAIALLPVVAFLAALSLMDSFRLVPPASIAKAIVFGAAVAIAALWLHDWLLQSGAVSSRTLTRYLAPLTEETAKSALIVLLVATGRIGFLIEAAVQGFAIGTGFALVENLTYLSAVSSGSIALWVVRGFGTGMLQGATTAVFAMLAKSLSDRHRDRQMPALLPGWIAAVVIHALFNHRLLPAMAQTLVLLIVLPVLVLVVFARSERATREWIGAGLDVDIELLALVASSDFAFTRFGRYLQDLRSRLSPPIVVDMFCLLRLELELAIQAKAMLMARQAGLEVETDEDLDACLAERKSLRRSIGTAGLLALKPLQVTSRRDDWHQHVLRLGRRAAR